MCARTAAPSRLHDDRRRRLENGAQHVAAFELVDNLIFDGLLQLAARRAKFPKA
jgi:hypothetical protein